MEEETWSTMFQNEFKNDKDIKEKDVANFLTGIGFVVIKGSKKEGDYYQHSKTGAKFSMPNSHGGKVDKHTIKGTLNRAQQAEQGTQGVKY